MSLAAGAHLGPYEILSHLGTGGMGVVYKARDTRLGREVAIKVLPEGLSARADVRERFEREARAISSLSHPHICPLYDVGSQDGIDYLVMEYLEGETLSHRLKKGPLPLDQTLRYAIEIASALGAAHRKGITHRDLKPGNVMLTKSGTKLLDFGLARMHTRGQSAGGSAVSTQTEPMTAEGTIVGTLQYMAPEQLEGKDADARTDIFAFGATLYEMATGRKAFEGQSSASLIAAIMHVEPPPISTLQPVTPPVLDGLVTRCLAKDPEERWQNARDMAEAMRWIAPAPVPGKSIRTGGARWPVWAGVALASVLSIVAIAGWLSRPTAPPNAPTVRFLTYSGHDSSPAASPDGKTVAFCSDRDGRSRIWLKELAQGNEVALTEGPNDNFPRFSPDGSIILFLRGPDGNRLDTLSSLDSSALYRVPALGGEPRKVIDDVTRGGGDWSPDGRLIAFIRFEGRKWVVRTVGISGEGVRAIAHSPNTIYLPRWSPDGHTIVAAEVPPADTGAAPFSIFSAAADGGGAHTVRAAAGGFSVAGITWSGTNDEVLYSQSEGITPGNAVSPGASRLVKQNLKSGASVQLLRSPQQSRRAAIIGPGRIVFDAWSSRQNLLEIALETKVPALPARLLTQGESQDRQPVYSPDGEWVLFTSNRSGNLDLWKISIRTGTLRRITEDPADDWDPAFTPDGKQIVWSSNRSGHMEIWIADADGSGAHQVSRDGIDAENPSASRDGWIVYHSGNPAQPGAWMIRSDGSEATRLTEFGSSTIVVSPDGKYVLSSDSAGALRVARIADRQFLSFQAPNAYRYCWMRGGSAVAFLAPDKAGRGRIWVQDFVPEQDTSKTRRPVGSLDPGVVAETFGVSPDGSHMTISTQEGISNLMIAEHLPGVASPVGMAK